MHPRDWTSCLISFWDYFIIFETSQQLGWLLVTGKEQRLHSSSEDLRSSREREAINNISLSRNAWSKYIQKPFLSPWKRWLWKSSMGLPRTHHLHCFLSQGDWHYEIRGVQCILHAFILARLLTVSQSLIPKIYLRYGLGKLTIRSLANCLHYQAQLVVFCGAKLHSHNYWWTVINGAHHGWLGDQTDKKINKLPIGWNRMQSQVCRWHCIEGSGWHAAGSRCSLEQSAQAR